MRDVERADDAVGILVMIRMVRLVAIVSDGAVIALVTMRRERIDLVVERAQALGDVARAVAPPDFVRHVQISADQNGMAPPPRPSIVTAWPAPRPDVVNVSEAPCGVLATFVAIAETLVSTPLSLALYVVPPAIATPTCESTGAARIDTGKYKKASAVVAAVAAPLNCATPEAAS